MPPKTRLIQSIVCGTLIGFVCGFVGAGGGMMMLLILTSVLGYELKTAVGTSVFIMTFTALTGALSHVALGGIPDLWSLLFCVLSTPCCGRRSPPNSPTKASPKLLNRVTGRGADRAGGGGACRPISRVTAGREVTGRVPVFRGFVRLTLPVKPARGRM